MNKIITIRASSLSDLFDCPARWEARNIYGKYMPSSGNAQLGTAIHAGAAVFDSSRINNAGITVDEAAAAVVDAIYKPEADVQWDEEASQKDAEKIGVALHKKYCCEISPKYEYVAVEVACDRIEITDLGIALTGTTDRIREIDSGYGVSDLKSGKTVVSADGTIDVKNHAPQAGVYELLAEQGSGLNITEPTEIIGLNTGKTEKTQRTGTAQIHGARDLLLGDEDTQGLLITASKVIHSGIFFGNPRSMLCSVKYCPIFKICKFKI